MQWRSTWEAAIEQRHEPLGRRQCRFSRNRVRRDVIVRSALGRFDRDVLARAGVQWLVLFEGINDAANAAMANAVDAATFAR